MRLTFDRIVSDSGVLGGKPCIRGTRISVEFLLELAASGASRGDIVRVYSNLTPEDVEEAFRYATHFLKNDVLISVEGSP